MLMDLDVSNEFAVTFIQAEVLEIMWCQMALAIAAGGSPHTEVHSRLF